MSDTERLAELLAGQASLEGAINTLTARLEAHLSTNKEAVNALFAARREHAGKIEDIRVDYVPKEDFEGHKRQNREENSAVLAAVNCIQWKVAKIAGALTLAAFAAGLLVKGIGVLAR